MKKKKQQFKEGSIVKIELPENRLIFGRILPGFHICIYDSIFSSNITPSPVESIIGNKIYLYVRIFQDVITKGSFEIIGFVELKQEDIANMPPHFDQDKVNIEECTIYYENGKENKVRPQDCIGLEGPIIWDTQGLIERIQDHYAGKKNPYVELFKVILTKDDPRYLNPKVRWNFSEEKFYRE